MPDRITMTPARQAVYHLGCAARHVWRAVVAFFPVAILMTLLLIVGLFIFALSSGCTHKPAPVISDAPPSERPAASMVSAAVTTARAENAKTVAGPSREAIELLLRVALSGLPLPTPADLARMAALASLAHDGKLTEANEKAAAYEHELRTLRENVAKERAESAARIEALIANHQRELDHAAYMAVVWVFAARLPAFWWRGGARTRSADICSSPADRFSPGPVCFGASLGSTSLRASRSCLLG